MVTDNRNNGNIGNIGDKFGNTNDGDFDAANDSRGNDALSDDHALDELSHAGESNPVERHDDELRCARSHDDDTDQCGNALDAHAGNARRFQPSDNGNDGHFASGHSWMHAGHADAAGVLLSGHAIDRTVSRE